MKIFVSYSRKDAGDFANQIQRHLSSFKYHIFTDVNSIRVGEIWSNTIEENISNCDIFVVIVTYGALQSPHVENEVLQAQKEKKTIIPCFHRSIIENDIRWELKQYQGVEFEEKYDLARNLQSEIEKRRKKMNRIDYKYKDQNREQEREAVHFINAQYKSQNEEKEVYSESGFHLKKSSQLTIIIIIMAVVALFLAEMVTWAHSITFLIISGVILFIIMFYPKIDRNQ